jgi:ribosome biogenesis GTPase
MSREERKLRKHLEAHANREMRKANKHLSKIRANQPKPPRERMDVRSVDDEEESRPAPVKKKVPKETGGPLSAGFVAEIGPGFCDVLSAGERLRCRPTSEVTVGDHVLFSLARRRVEEVLPRRTVLSRTDPHNPRVERVIAANVDVVVNVVSLKTPPLRPGLIDRYLIATGKSGAEPLLCVNKIDLLADVSELDPVKPYQDLGITVIFCSAASGAGLGELLDALAGKLCVFAGHSGVGKSSLLNALDPRLHLNTGSVSSGNEKGRHTTTTSGLYELPNGATLIDTPGIREFGLWDVSKSDLRRYFHEFASYPCPFSDCTHTHEPDCGVKAAVESGEIAGARYDSYVRILASSPS